MQRIILQITYSLFFRWLLKIFIGVRFDNTDFLRAEKQFIIVANHNSHLDTITILSSLPRQIIDQVKPVAAADYFARTKFQAHLSRYFLNALLIERKRNKADRSHDPINVMLQALDKGYSLILFPEGTRGEPETLQPLKPGVGILLSKRPHIPYVPAFMTGMGKIMPKGDNLIVPYNSRLQYGLPRCVKTNDVAAIMKQVEGDLIRLRDNDIPVT